MPTKIHLDDGELTIQGFTKVRTFEPNLAILIFDKKAVIVEGVGLRVSYFSAHEMTLVGDFKAVRLEDEGSSNI